MNENKDHFLAHSEAIDWQNPTIITKAQELAEGATNKLEVAKNCFEFVRDQIQHSGDHPSQIITYLASDVLKHRTGYCFAKSHLLAALLRANHIPAGLCYQRLYNEEDRSFCLHGLNSVYLEPYGWYRVDARGNKQGVDAQFCPPAESLAFKLCYEDEIDIEGIWVDPHETIKSLLTGAKSQKEVDQLLPGLNI